MTAPRGARAFIREAMRLGWLASYVDQTEIGAFVVRAMRRDGARETYRNTVISIRWLQGHATEINVSETLPVADLGRVAGLRYVWETVSPPEGGWRMADLLALLPPRDTEGP